ncbi:MAG: hypothetical protein ACI9ZF_000330 [Bradyrhizobium sp.]|jgi:hypothetical protein
MLIVIYLLLILLSLVLWIWLTRRIWRVSPAAAGASFFLLLPAIYWSWKLWNDPAARIRGPAIANVVITVILLVMSYRIGDTAVQDFLQKTAAQQAQQAAPQTDMNDWCRAKYGTSFDRARGACVEKKPPAAQ